MVPIVRVGIGYDVHAFVRGRKFMLGGVQIPHRFGLSGHSDADVLLHAICDALLGAAALGDIGKHFPNTSPKFRNISSLRLLNSVRRLLVKHHFRVVNLDATILLQAPKILKYSPKMVKNIADTLGIHQDLVSIKATTNEGLGFLGRGEGCAALATATIIPSIT
jgi:2-C-methyl-D-erythritol 2,4-cyclodiphosphate synthase